MKRFIYRLFFTRDDDLDLLQVCLVGMIVFFMMSFVMDAMGIWDVKVAAWASLASIFGVIAILGAPTPGAAQILAASKLPGEMAAGVANAREPYGEPRVRREITDDGE